MSSTSSSSSGPTTSSSSSGPSLASMSSSASSSSSMSLASMSSSSSSSSTSSSMSSSSSSATTASSRSSTSSTTTAPPAGDTSIDGTLTFGFDGGSAQEFVEDFQNDPNGEVGTGLKTSIASVVDGANASDVNITAVTLVERRRLEALLARGLQFEQCQVDYSIRLKAALADNADALVEQLLNTSAATVLQERLNEALPSFNVSEIAVVAEVVVVTTTTTALSGGTTLFEEDPSGSARGLALGLISPALMLIPISLH
mmetsp:Transcript_74790/g.139618  ORF Transcript_74790/g.139618 Transcript_74790/m.139618 type:complete len:257 (+) Transcript_74790:2-772(+)